LSEHQADYSLTNTVAGSTQVSFVDGQAGELLYRGYSIKELAKYSSFDEVSYLLLCGKLPSQDELYDWKTLLAATRKLEPESERLLWNIKLFHEPATPMDVLRTALSDLALRQMNIDNTSQLSLIAHGITLISQHPTLVAAYHRIHRNQPPVGPLPEIGHAANFLWMLTGTVPSDEEVRALDIALILHADHGYNASTFTARVCASTGSDIFSCICAAIGALKGPRHGGANVNVFRMLQEIRDPKKVEGYFSSQLEQNPKWRIPGFGHRIYKTKDPRAQILKPLAKEICHQKRLPWFDIALEVEKQALTLFRKRGKEDLQCNVDFYSAPLFGALGIDPDFFPCMFALARTPGLVAQCMEEYENGRIIRPLNVYTGSPLRSYVQLKDR